MEQKSIILFFYKALTPLGLAYCASLFQKNKTISAGAIVGVVTNLLPSAK